MGPNVKCYLGSEQVLDKALIDVACFNISLHWKHDIPPAEKKGMPATQIN